MHISIEDIAVSLGTTTSDFDSEFIGLYESSDWSYSVLEGTDLDKVFIELFEFLKTDSQKIGSSIRTSEWQNGWNENLTRYKESKNLDDIVPRFIRSNQPVRFRKQFILPNDPNFELNYVKLTQLWIFKKFLSEGETIHEFGCGSGINLVAMSKMFPHKKLFGYDFVQSSVDLINAISESTNPLLTGIKFDMISPIDSELDCNSSLLTFGAIEQLAGKFHNFIDYIIMKKPKICLFIEPVVEMYDDTSLVDYTAKTFLKQRGYTTGLLPYLQLLHSQKRVELIKYHRPQVGSLRMEGYMQMIWRPL